MSTTDIKVSNLIVNKLTLSKYKELKTAGTLSETELYEITDVDTAIETGSADAADRSLSNLNSTGQAVLDMKANIDLSNLTNTGKNIANWSNNVTNCITEIPQDIKLELKDGTLTLKSGSKVYVPNGVGVFDAVEITKDVTLKYNTESQLRMLFYNVTSKTLTHVTVNNVTSGSTDTGTGTWRFWYDTTNNYIKKFQYDETTPINDVISYPICTFTSTTDGIQSIDQVFNGFGYIGSTIFALPGVKGLIPNGRNTDGTLKNAELNNTVVHTRTLTRQMINGVIVVSRNGSLAERDKYYEVNSYADMLSINMDGLYYVKDENICYSWSGGIGTIYFGFTPALYFSSTSNGTITSFNPKTAFHATDYYDFKQLDNEAVKLGADNTFTGYNNFDKRLKILDNFSSGGSSAFILEDNYGKGNIQDIAYYYNNAIYHRMSAQNSTSKKSGYLDVLVDDSGNYHARVGGDGNLSIPDSGNALATMDKVNSRITSVMDSKLKVVSALPSSPETGVFYYVTK